MDNTQLSLSGALKHRMNFLTQQQGLISSNIANVNTPNYLAQKAVFQSMVQSNTKQPKTTHPQHLHATKRSQTLQNATQIRANPKHNGNTVHIDEQMVQMNETQLQYRLATSLYSKHAAMQKMALGAGAQ